MAAIHSRFQLRTAAPTRFAGRRRSRSAEVRRGAAVVELALVAPLLVGLLAGIIEIGEALRVEAALSKACCNGCASACRPGGDNSDVFAAVESALSIAGLPVDEATVTILINNQAGSVATAKLNDKITVTVELPASSVRLLHQNFFSFQNSAHSETTTMLKQG